MAKRPRGANTNGVIVSNEAVDFPRGFTITDNRIEDNLQRFLTPSEYAVWRQYLRFWGSNKKKAYPSLAYLSKVIGISEKTIRKCNKELVRKKFLTYIQGGPGRSNLYIYKSIDSILAYYKVKLEPKADKEREPIVEGGSLDKVDKALNKLEDNRKSASDSFIKTFKEEYFNKFGCEYILEERDAIAIYKSILSDNYDKLIETFFDSKNKYIKKSDRSIYLFFRPTIIKSVIAEYSETDRGRWDAQVNNIIANLKTKKLLPNKTTDIEPWLNENVKLSGANSERDAYVKAALVEKVRAATER